MLIRFAKKKKKKNAPQVVNITELKQESLEKLDPYNS